MRCGQDAACVQCGADVDDKTSDSKAPALWAQAPCAMAAAGNRCGAGERALALHTKTLEFDHKDKKWFYLVGSQPFAFPHVC